MKKAAAYARYSSENQRDESIDAQLCAIEEFARKNDIVIVATYIDRAKSATTADRPSFQEMIKMSETGTFDTIIVHKLDRFARSKYDSAIYKQKLKVNKVSLLSVTENLDGTPESIILESVLEAMAEYYSKNLAREIMKGTMENAKKTVHCGGIPPLGFDVVDKHLAINEHEAEAVRIIFQMYAEGEGYTRIINTLNDKGYKTKLGNKFGKNSLFEILRNEKYIGVYTYNKSSGKTAKGTYNRHAYKDDSEVVRVNNGCPQIVSDELFRKVEQRRLQNQNSTARNRERQKYLLSGLVFCGQCGSPMHANRRRKESQLTFRCNKKAQTVSCNAKEVNMAYLENYVLDELQTSIFSNVRIPEIMRLIERHRSSVENDAKSASEAVITLIKGVQKNKAKIMKAIENGICESYFAERLKELTQQEETLKAKLLIASQPKSFSITRKEVALLINSFRRMRAENNFNGLRKIIQNFVDAIKVTDDRIEVYLKIQFGDVNIDSKTIISDKNELKNKYNSTVPLAKNA